MDAPYTVGALARQAGVTPKTMRFYEAIGRLPGAFARRSAICTNPLPCHCCEKSHDELVINSQAQGWSGSVGRGELMQVRDHQIWFDAPWVVHRTLVTSYPDST